MPNKSKLILYNYGHSYNIQLLKVVQDKRYQSRLMEQNRGSKKHTLTNTVKIVNKHIKAIQLLFSHVPLWTTVNYTTPGSLLLHCLPQFAQFHVHWVSDAIQPSSSATPFSSYLQSFPVSQLFIPSGQNIGDSASASVLPMNIQGWSPLRSNALISEHSKGLSRVFSSTIQKHQFFGTQTSLWSNSHIWKWLLEKP